MPEPKYGQKEWDLFTEMYGNLYSDYEDLQFDPEEKITEFNYEKFIPEYELANMDTQSQEFKDMIKMMNVKSKTQYEQHKANQQQFRELMPILAKLNLEESEIFIHMIRNKRCGDLNADKARTNELIDEACENNLEV